MDYKSIEEVVLKALAAVLKCEVKSDFSRENTPQWDSLKHIEVIFTVEDELDIQFTEDEMGGLDSVSSIVGTILTRHAT